MFLKHLIKNLPQRLVVTLVLLALVMSPAAPKTSVTAAQSDYKLICASNPSSTFTLTALDGYIQLPDGNTVYMWGYSEGNRAFQHPGTSLCVNQGDTVTIVLNNTLAYNASIIFPGQTDVMANGQPAQPQFDGGALTSLTNTAPADGGSVTYSFVANTPGTFIYESGTNPEVQVQMGLFGALIVRPTLGANYAYTDTRTEFNPDAEFLMLLSEIDPVFHQYVEQLVSGAPILYNMNNYIARYWLVNGRSFPDSIAPNNVVWLPAQPYSSLAYIYPYDAALNPLPALERYLSAGPVDYPFHPHGNHGRLIARNGQLLIGPGGEDLSFEKFTVNVHPSQTLDTLFEWIDVDAYDPDFNPVPVNIPGEQNLTYGQYFSGSPYLGDVEPLPPGATTYNVCGEYYHAAHNHALSTVTAWGMTMSGQLTYTRIDPLQPNNCP